MSKTFFDQLFTSRLIARNVNRTRVFIHDFLNQFETGWSSVSVRRAFHVNTKNPCLVSVKLKPQKLVWKILISLRAFQMILM